MVTVARSCVSLSTTTWVTVTPSPKLTSGVPAVKCVAKPETVTTSPTCPSCPWSGSTALMYAGPAVTVKRLAPVAVTPAVVALTALVVLAATGDTETLTVA